MKVKIGAAFTVLVAVTLSPSAVNADTDVNFGGETNFDGSVEFFGEAETQSQTRDEGSTTANEVADSLAEAVDDTPNEERWIAIPVPGSSGNSDDQYGGFCRDVEYRNVTDLTSQEVDVLTNQAELAFARFVDTARWTGDYGLDGQQPLCPIDEMEGLDPVFIELYVREAIESQVPRPEPEIPPGYALTGMPAYLVDQRELTLAPIEIEMDLGFTNVAGTAEGTAVTTVNWGDGTETEHHTPGLPYPHGEVQHTFSDKGKVDIQVTDSWHIEYEAADGAIVGTLVETLEPISIDGFEIREYRAVRTGEDPSDLE